MIDLNMASAADLDALPASAGQDFEVVRSREEARQLQRGVRQLEERPGLA